MGHPCGSPISKGQAGWEASLGQNGHMVMMAEPLCFPPETITTLLSGYAPIQSKTLKRAGNEGVLNVLISGGWKICCVGIKEFLCILYWYLASCFQLCFLTFFFSPPKQSHEIS